MSNLPPGVTDSMIPGNRPEDLEAEAFEEAFAAKLKECEIFLMDCQFEKLAAEVWAMIGTAKREGYNEGCVDTQRSQREPEDNFNIDDGQNDP